MGCCPAELRRSISSAWWRNIEGKEGEIGEEGEGIYRGGHGVAVVVSRERDRGRDQDDGFQ
jgi:hypothetical protein